MGARSQMISSRRRPRNRRSCPQKSDYLFAPDCAAVQSEAKGSGGQSGNRRHPLPVVEGKLQNRCLSSGRPGAESGRDARTGRFHRGRRWSGVPAGLFFNARPFRLFQAWMASSFAFARPASGPLAGKAKFAEQAPDMHRAETLAAFCAPALRHSWQSPYFRSGIRGPGLL